MYQPGAGGNFCRAGGERLQWCNQASYDYVAATSPYLFQIMTGGEDRTDPSDTSYAHGSDANSTVGRLRIATEADRIGTTSSIDEALALLEQGYTVVAAATGEPRGHLAVGRAGTGATSLLFSNVGRTVGILELDEAFPGSQEVVFYYDPDQNRSLIDRTQTLNSWGYK